MSALLGELLAYVSFDDADRARLRGLHALLAPRFPAIAGAFYDAVWRHPGAAAVLSGPTQIERLRASLIDWMTTGLLGPYDDQFYEQRSRIGRRHVAIGLAHHYMFTAMNVVRRAYHDHVDELVADHEARALHRSVDKLLDLELAIMVRHYQLDAEERRVARERQTQEDRLLALQTLTAGIAHEVRNPLNAAQLQLELLERRLQRDPLAMPRLLEPCELAQAELERLTRLLDDFLLFARPPELHRDAEDVVPVLRQVVELEGATAAQRGSVLALASVPPRLVVQIDTTKLHHIVLNLVRNALEAVPPGGRVVVGLEPLDQAFRITVTDDGPGIPEDVRPRIYEPFFSTKPGGTGLGMSIVHSLVALHGGSIGFETSPRGTRFELTFPSGPRGA